MNIIILYLSVWSFVAIVVFLSIASQIMYSTDIESTSTGTRHGKSHTNIFHSPIDDKTWDLSDKRMIVIYVYPGYNAGYVKRLLCDMHNNICADSSDVAYCMRRQHLSWYGEYIFKVCRTGHGILFVPFEHDFLKIGNGRDMFRWRTEWRDAYK